MNAANGKDGTKMYIANANRDTHTHTSIHKSHKFGKRKKEKPPPMLSLND